MADENKRTPERIPVRFVGGEGSERDASELEGEGDLTPEEIGRESSYEDETEVQRRINRGQEGDSEEDRERADDEDLAGTVSPSELPRSRDDQDTTVSHADVDEKPREADADDKAQRADASGPLMAELVGTRAELRRVQSEAGKLKAERQDLIDKLMRRQAEFENFRKRTERERSETYNHALGDVVGRLLPVLDNLRRALDAEKTVEGVESDEFRHFLQGIELIHKQLNGVLEGLGVEVVPTIGEPFDPHVHEAVATEASDEYETDTVMEEMQRGYRLGDKLLRPAMVKVAK